jgi:hypothetical protein
MLLSKHIRRRASRSLINSIGIQTLTRRGAGKARVFAGCGLRGAGTHVVDPAGDEQVARGIDIAAVLVAICWGPAFNIS